MTVLQLQPELRKACLDSGFKLCDKMTEQQATGVWIQWLTFGEVR